MRLNLLLLKFKTVSHFRPVFSISEERSYSCPARLIALVGFLCFVMSIPCELFGQTEISGEVTGEWTAEGSPYTVVDSTWIPEGGELIIQRDVEVIFQENQGLYIFGHFEVRGVQPFETVMFTFWDIEHWRGLRFYGEREAVFEGLETNNCPDTLITLDNNCSLEFQDCKLYMDDQFIWAHGPPWTNHGWQLAFFNTNMHSSGQLRMGGGTLTAENCDFDFVRYPPAEDPGFQGAHDYEFINCEIIGGIRSGFNTVVEDCEIYCQGQNWGTGVSINGQDGRMLRTVVEGPVSLSGDFFHYTPFEDNVVTGELSVVGLFANINQSNIGTQVRIRNARANFRNCILPGHFTASGSNVTVDSCQLVNEGFLDEVLSFGENTQAELTRSVFSLDWAHFPRDVQVNLDHNTIIFKPSVSYSMLVYGTNISVTNNIFITQDVEVLFNSDSAFTFEYNCVWGFDNFRNGRGQEMFDLPPNNIEADPLFEWYVNLPLLTADSPCIDAGDPDAPIDRDGTRSDIGAYTFNQPNFISRNDPGLYNSDSPILVQAYPNPFNSSLNISYSMETTNHISIKLYDLAGREVLSRSGSRLTNGTGFLNLNTSSIPTGRYHLIVRSDNFSEVVPILRIN